MCRVVKFLLLWSLVLFTVSCKSRGSANGFSDNANEFAGYFSIQICDDGSQLLTINENWNREGIIHQYRLIDKNSANTYDYKVDEKILKTPLERVVCMSTSHISYIAALNKSDKIVAVSGGRYVSDTSILRNLREGRVSDIGFESSLNYETLLSLSPDLVFTYGISGENNIYIDKIKSLGINVIALGDYMEEHPLGKAEYLKLFGLLFNCSEYADSLYHKIRDEYLSIKERLTEKDYKPLVLVNAPWKDVWYIPGYTSYMSTLIRDAGGEVLGSREMNFHTGTNSIEEIFRLAERADFWLNTNNYKSIEELRVSNPLFSKLKVLERGRVFNNVKLNTMHGGSDFWEKGVIEPHIILKDIMTILHPSLFKGDTLKYYMELK